MYQAPVPNRIITKDEFRKRTKGGTFDRRKTIKLIDDALDEWHKVQNFDNTVRVYKECRHWLKAKQQKTDGNTPKRKNHIQILLASTLPWMRHLDPQLGRAFDAFQAKKGNQGAHQGLKPMAGVYKHERSLYLQNNKQRAPSASLMDDKYWQLQNKPQNLPGEFGDLSEAEYAQVDRLTGGDKDVVYLRKMSRLKYMQLIDVNGKLTGIDGQLTSTDPKFGWPFAMDRYGNVFTMDDQATPGQINHSTFNAGNDVVCAGFIKITNGNLLLLSNNSGHYKPGRDHLKNAIKILEDDGVDMSNFVVEFHDYSSGTLHVFEYTLQAFKYSRDGIQMGSRGGVTQIC